MIFDKFRRSHVTTNACGILLEHCLDPPAHGGLGLRRVQWTANADNKSSIAAAQKLGFQMEGILRWVRILPQEKSGPNASFAGSEKYPGHASPGRHTAVLSFCWDDWALDGQRERLFEMMKPRA